MMMPSNDMLNSKPTKSNNKSSKALATALVRPNALIYIQEHKNEEAI